jgi:hypothetical protein
MINFALFGVGFIGLVHLTYTNSNPRTRLSPSERRAEGPTPGEAAVKSLKENRPVRLEEV